MTKLSTKTKIFLLLLIISAASITYLLLVSKPAPSPTTLPLLPTQSPFKYSINTLTPSSTVLVFTPPAKLTSYNYQITSIDTAQLFTYYQNLFHLTVPAGPALTDDKGSIYLTHDGSTRTVNLLFDYFQNTSLYTGPDSPPTDQAIASAQNYLSQAPSLSSLQPISTNVKYLLSGHSELQPSDASNYHLISVPFSVMLDNIPVYSELKSDPPAVVLIGQKQALVKLVISQPFNLTTSNPISQSPLKLSDLLASGSFKNSIAITYLSSRNTPLTNNTIDSVQLNTVSLEYRLNPNSNLLIPYYKFAGTINGTDSIDIVHPAIPTL